MENFVRHSAFPCEWEAVSFVRHKCTSICIQYVIVEICVQWTNKLRNCSVNVQHLLLLLLFSMKICQQFHFFVDKEHLKVASLSASRTLIYFDTFSKLLHLNVVISTQITSILLISDRLKFVFFLHNLSKVVKFPSKKINSFRYFRWTFVSSKRTNAHEKRCPLCQKKEEEERRNVSCNFEQQMQKELYEIGFDTSTCQPLKIEMEKRREKKNHYAIIAWWQAKAWINQTWQI